MKTDVLIIGGGLAGLMAAREAVLAGLDTTIAQDGRGASPWVHGFNAPCVREGDSAEVFEQDTLQSGQGLSDRKLAHTLSHDAEGNFEDLLSWGLKFNRKEGEYQALRPLGASYPRVVSIGNETGVAILEKLEEDFGEKWHELKGYRAVRLLKKGDAVCGACLYSRGEARFVNIYASAVVLACGGYCGIFPVSTNKRDSGGDAIGMAYEAGAKLCDMEFIQFEPSAAMWPPALIGTSMITTLYFDGAVMRNKEGERFMLRYSPEGERVGKDVQSKRISAEVAAGHGTPHGGVYMDLTGVPREKLEKDYPMYLKRYQDVGIDLSKEWIELGPAPHTSLGGVCGDENGCTCLQGLFVCGEALGGLHGANRIGGSAGLETMVFGKRAGKSAAAYAGSHEASEGEGAEPVYGKTSVKPELEALRGEMKKVLAESLSAVRNGRQLEKAVSVLEEVLAKADALRGLDAEEEFLRLRLHNDLTAALLTAAAALARDSSLGCHCRSDEAAAPEIPYRVVLQKKENGLDLTKENISE